MMADEPEPHLLISAHHDSFTLVVQSESEKSFIWDNYYCILKYFLIEWC